MGLTHRVERLEAIVRPLPSRTRCPLAPQPSAISPAATRRGIAFPVAAIAGLWGNVARSHDWAQLVVELKERGGGAAEKEGADHDCGHKYDRIQEGFEDQIGEVFHTPSVGLVGDRRYRGCP